MSQVECAYKGCRKTFTKNRSDKRYCSRRCKDRASDIRNGRTRKRLEARGNRSPKVWQYRKYVGDNCENCGFVPIHICQLDVDHIDGDHNNNTPSNLRTLCANCHRLKTFINQDWRSKKQV